MSDLVSKYERITAGELPTDTVALARAILGLVVIRDSPQGCCTGRIVEVEAYVADDPASHAFLGKTKRNASMFLRPFRAYVYRIYGTAFCLNITSESPDVGAAVLVRALEPLDGASLMEFRRGTGDVRDLCRGPGRLCKALEIDLRHNGLDALNDSELWMGRSRRSIGRIGKSKRIGISKAAHRRLRFYEIGNRYVSGPRALSP
ncbi:MAG: DNA-3-methyladenine glycosylase [Candidatus Eremiobacteraeota bacterium]|nr:DNA-3-methyladenine glycosylase [Candidatus Eremiobacteraeota bacterium]